MKALEAQNKESKDQEATRSTKSPNLEDFDNTSASISELSSENQLKSPCRKISNKKPRQAPSSTKNITINFGKAIASFAASNLAMPYLDTHLKQKKLAYIDFFDFATAAKNSIRSIDSFRNLMIVQGTDSPKQAALKQTFQAMGETFIKYFSVNWIIHGKVTHKMVYLKYRHKMMRRIVNPEGFTYIKKRMTQRKREE